MKIFLDLDNFLYNAKNQPHLIAGLEQNIVNWVIRKKSLPLNTAADYVSDLYKKFGGAPNCFIESGDIQNNNNWIDCVQSINSFDKFPQIVEESETTNLIKYLDDKHYDIEILTDSIYQYAETLIDILGIKKYIKNIYSIDKLDYILKKDPRFFPYLISLKQINMDHDYFCDDNIKNISNAKNAGFLNLILLDKNSKYENTEVSCHKVLSLSEIQNIIS